MEGAGLVGESMNGPWTIRITAEMMAKLHQHLFPGDGDEHGAVIGASVVSTTHGTRFLVRRIYLAKDGVDYLPGKTGYRMLTASFVGDRVLDCEVESLSYFAVHCHGGTDSVAFSSIDLASHERGYPALLDILEDKPVGGLVFARNAVAGDIWLTDGRRVALDRLDVIGRPSSSLFVGPQEHGPKANKRFDRQVRLFGDRGQERLNSQKVGIIGAGGVGSLVSEYLARLGVGNLVVVDPDRIEPTNLTRVVGSLRRDTRPWLTGDFVPTPFRNLAEQMRTSKVRIARRVAKAAQPEIKFAGITGDVVDQDIAERLIDCDYLFLAADTMQARLVFNALVHQYLIPGVQMGAKVHADRDTGEVLSVFSVSRQVLPGRGCLWCNGLISASKLQEEATSPVQRARQRYVTDDDVQAPSVITLNAVAASHAVNEYMFNQLGLKQDPSLKWSFFNPEEAKVSIDVPRRDINCHECDRRLGAGTSMTLPTRRRRKGRGTSST